MRMTRAEKILYHQIHPLKLAVDISSGLFTTYLMWVHYSLWWTLLIAFLPSIVVSLLIIRFANLETYKNSKFGNYLRMYMTRIIEAIRLTGQIVMWAAAWMHLPWLIVIGFLIIVAGWMNGLFKPKRV